MKRKDKHLFYSIEGASFPRIRYGSEREDLGAEHWPCHDCGAVQGATHVPGCDVERCPKCGLQAIGCDCRYDRKNPRGIKEARQAIADLWEEE
jgi:hypothetical protein